MSGTITLDAAKKIVDTCCDAINKASYDRIKLKPRKPDESKSNHGMTLIKQYDLVVKGWQQEKYTLSMSLWLREQIQIHILITDPTDNEEYTTSMQTDTNWFTLCSEIELASHRLVYGRNERKHKRELKKATDDAAIIMQKALKIVMSNFLITHIGDTKYNDQLLDDFNTENALIDCTLTINQEQTAIVAEALYGENIKINVNPCVSGDLKQLNYKITEADPDDIAKAIIDLIITEHQKIRLRQQILEG